MNMLEIRQLSEVCANSIGLLLNAIIIILAVTESNQTLRVYSRMIIAVSIVDLLYIFFSTLCAQNVVINDGAIIFISTNKWISNIDGGSYFLAVVFVFIVALTNYVVPVEYYFRYSLVVKGQPLSAKKIACILLILAASAIGGGAQFIMLFVRPEEENIKEFGHFLGDSVWVDPTTGKMPKMVANSFGNLLFSIELIGVGIIAMLSYSLAIYFGIKTYQKLDAMKHLMSARTLRLQRSLTTTLIIKAIGPFCLCTFPVVVVFLSVVLRISIPNLGIYLVILINWIPVIGPLCSLILIQSYRHRLYVKFMRLLGKESNDKVHIIASTTCPYLPSGQRRLSVMYKTYSN